MTSLLSSCYYGRHAMLLPQCGREALHNDSNNGFEGG